MTAAPPPEVIHFRRHAETGADTVFITNSTRMLRWHHVTYSFGYVIRGAGEVLYRGSTELWRPGLTAFQEPGEFHQVTKTSEPRTSKVAFVAPSYIERSARELGLIGWPHIKQHRVDHEDACHGLRNLIECLRGDASLLERQSRLAIYTQLMLERYSETTASPLARAREPVAVRKARDLIQARCCEFISLESLSSEVGLSKFHLLRSFARGVGVPPHEYQIQVRLQRARDLLNRGISPAMAAAAVGFSDQSHLNRHFKRRLGLTLGEYAAQIRA